MVRHEYNVTTGELKEITLSPDEEAAALAQTVAWNAQHTPDILAAQAIDRMDRLQFKHLFNLENRMRVIEGKQPITVAVYRQALIDEWKTEVLR